MRKRVAVIAALLGAFLFLDASPAEARGFRCRRQPTCCPVPSYHSYPARGYALYFCNPGSGWDHQSNYLTEQEAHDAGIAARRRSVRCGQPCTSEYGGTYTVCEAGVQPIPFGACAPVTCSPVGHGRR